MHESDEYGSLFFVLSNGKENISFCSNNVHKGEERGDKVFIHESTTPLKSEGRPDDDDDDDVTLRVKGEVPVMRRGMFGMFHVVGARSQMGVEEPEH